MKRVLGLMTVLWVGLAFGYTEQDKERYATAVAKATLDRNYLIKQYCQKEVLPKDRAECIKQVDDGYNRAVKGLREQHLKETK